MSTISRAGVRSRQALGRPAYAGRGTEVSRALKVALFCFIPYAATLSAAGLEIVRPSLSQMEGGTPEPPGFQYASGETLYFSCRVAGFSRSEDQKVHIAYSVQAFDPKGVALEELYKNDVQVELSAQDKEWMPKIATAIAIPPLTPSGAYKIVVKAEDTLARTATESAVPFQVRGHDIEPSDTLVVRNFHFYHGEEDAQPALKAVYKPGDGVWARFDIVGYQYGPKNKIDVSYVTSVIAPSGKVLWTQPSPAVEQSDSFYPKRYVSASMGITLQNNIRPGDYTIAVEVKDSVGNQSFEQKYTFTVE